MHGAILVMFKGAKKFVKMERPCNLLKLIWQDLTYNVNGTGTEDAALGWI